MKFGALMDGAVAALRAPDWLAGARLATLTGSAPMISARTGTVDPDSIRVARRLLKALARVPGGRWRATCLYLGAAEVLLRRAAGEDARLRLGARRDGEGIGAHAWVESGGVPVGHEAGNAERFAALA